MIKPEYFGETKGKLHESILKLWEAPPDESQVAYWVPGHLNPLHEGMYQRLFVAQGRPYRIWSWWNGTRWSLGSAVLATALYWRPYASELVCKFAWRGLKEYREYL